MAWLDNRDSKKATKGKWSFFQSSSHKILLNWYPSLILPRKIAKKLDKIAACIGHSYFEDVAPVTALLRELMQIKNILLKRNLKAEAKPLLARSEYLKKELIKRSHKTIFGNHFSESSSIIKGNSHQRVLLLINANEVIHSPSIVEKIPPRLYWSNSKKPPTFWQHHSNKTIVDALDLNVVDENFSTKPNR